MIDKKMNNNNNSSVSVGNSNNITSINNIPIEVFNEFEEIRKSGVTNMCLKDIVIQIAYQKGYLALASYCLNYKSSSSFDLVSTEKYVSILKSYNEYKNYLKQKASNNK